ncbi:hypothetical protein BKA61DRAFT_679891 [Leptodontidium sp. MPI-SDFR-AT-0119]|nr:hypothetical protein BKA61DRAFT_679891 [Leptodontidium sp. MPI-SDFR-AT-0119]
MATLETAKGSRKAARRKVHGKSILYFLKTTFRNNRPLIYSINLLAGAALFVVSAASFDISLYSLCNNSKPTINYPNYIIFPSFCTSLSTTYCIRPRRFSAASASKLYAFQRTPTVSERLANLCFNIADIQNLHEKCIQAALSLGLDVATMESDMQSGQTSEVTNVSINALSAKSVEGEAIFQEFEDSILVIAQSLAEKFSTQPNTFFSSEYWGGATVQGNLTLFKKIVVRLEPEIEALHDVVMSVRNHLVFYEDDLGELLVDETGKWRRLIREYSLERRFDEIESLEKRIKVQKHEIGTLVVAFREARKDIGTRKQTANSRLPEG